VSENGAVHECKTHVVGLELQQEMASRGCTPTLQESRELSSSVIELIALRLIGCDSQHQEPEDEAAR